MCVYTRVCAYIVRRRDRSVTRILLLYCVYFIYVRPWNPFPPPSGRDDSAHAVVIQIYTYLCIRYRFPVQYVATVLHVIRLPKKENVRRPPPVRVFNKTVRRGQRDADKYDVFLALFPRGKRRIRVQITNASVWIVFDSVEFYSQKL